MIHLLWSLLAVWSLVYLLHAALRVPGGPPRFYHVTRPRPTWATVRETLLATLFVVLCLVGFPAIAVLGGYGAGLGFVVGGAVLLVVLVLDVRQRWRRIQAEHRARMDTIAREDAWHEATCSGTRPASNPPA